VVRLATWCAEWSINRPIYTGGTATPMKWGLGGLVDRDGRESMVPVSSRRRIGALDGR
jgi:hypothetical protein